MLLMFAIAPGQMLERIQQIQVAGRSGDRGRSLDARDASSWRRAGIGMMEAHPLFGSRTGPIQVGRISLQPRADGPCAGTQNRARYLRTVGRRGRNTNAGALYGDFAPDPLDLPECPEVAWIARRNLGARAVISGRTNRHYGAEFFLTAQYIKEVWVLISLAPNLYAISLQLAAAVNTEAVLRSGPACDADCFGATPAAHRMRILLVSEMIPWLPSHDGFRVSPANLIRNLSDRKTKFT